MRVVGGENACAEAAGALAGPGAAGGHLAACASCRATARTLELVRRTTGERCDLWLRLRARLAEARATERVHLRVPPAGWATVAAAAAVAASLVVVAEPGRLLALVLGMV